MKAEGAPAACFGFYIDRPCRLTRDFDVESAKGRRNLTELYFDQSNCSEFTEFVKSCCAPATSVIKSWLDAGAACHLSISGTFLEQLMSWEPEVFEELVELARHPGCEILGQTYYRSVSGLFSDLEEFSSQVAMHRDLMDECFGVRPDVYANPEFLYSCRIARALGDLGFRAAYTHSIPGSQDVNKNLAYNVGGLTTLVWNCTLSDDIAVRLPEPKWDQQPLSPEKYAGWLCDSPGDCIHLIVDLAALATKNHNHTTIPDFLKKLPEALRERNIRTILPSEAAATMPVHELAPEAACSLDATPEPSDWMSSIMQHCALFSIEHAKDRMIDPTIWRHMQSVHHFQAMAMKSGSCGSISCTASHQEVYEYFANYMRMLSHMEERAAPHLPSRKAAKTLRCLPPEKAFHFWIADRPIGISAHSLEEFASTLDYIPDASFAYHQERGDFSRWFEEVLEDELLARETAGCTSRDALQEQVMARTQVLCNRLS